MVNVGQGCPANVRSSCEGSGGKVVAWMLASGALSARVWNAVDTYLLHDRGSSSADSYTYTILLWEDVPHVRLLLY